MLHGIAIILARRVVGVLASTAVVKIKHYDRVLNEVGLKAHYPDDQAGLMAVIRGVKRGDTGLANRNRFRQISQDLFASGCDVLLIACTELSVLADTLDDGLPMTDAMDVLANEIVRLATQSQQQFISTHSLAVADGQSRI